MSISTQSKGRTLLAVSSLTSSMPIEVLLAAAQHYRNGNQAHMPVLDTMEKKSDDVFDSNVSNKTGSIIALEKQ